MLVGRVRTLKRLRDPVDETSHLREPLRHNIYQRSWRQSDRERSSNTRKLGSLPDLLIRFGRCLHTSLPAGTAQITEFFIRKVRDIIYYLAGCQEHVTANEKIIFTSGSNEAQSDPDGVAMSLDRIRNLAGITTTHCGHHGDPPQPAGTEDQQVTVAESFDGQLQLSEAILLIRVDTSLIKDHVWLKLVENSRKMVGENGQVLVISQAIGQVDVEGPLLFAGRKVLLAVHGEGEDIRIALKDSRGAIALVDVTIDHGKAAGQTVSLQDANGNGNVIENTVAFTVVRIGMVGPAGEVGGKSIPKRAPGRKDRPLDGCPRTTDQPLRPRKADPANLVTRQAPTGTALPV